MLATPHLLVGAAVGAVAAPLGLPAVFVLSFISHFAIDRIPHTDSALLDDRRPLLQVSTKDLISVCIEIAIGVILFVYLWSRANWETALLVGSFGGIFPDLIDNVPWWSGTIRKTALGNVFHQYHTLFDGGVEKGKLVGVATQFVAIAVAVIILMQK